MGGGGVWGWVGVVVGVGVEVRVGVGVVGLAGGYYCCSCYSGCTVSRRDQYSYSEARDVDVGYPKLRFSCDQDSRTT